MTTPQRFQFEREIRATLQIPKPIDVFQLQTTAGTVFTADAAADFQIHHLVATNVTGADDYVTVYLVPSGGSPSTGNMIIYQRAVPAKLGVTIFNEDNRGLMQPGMTLRALCGVNDAVNIWGYGYDYQGVYSNG